MKNAWYKKKAWCFAILFLLLLCFVAWVGKTGPEDPHKEPFGLTISAGSDTFSTSWREGHWNYLSVYGNETYSSRGGSAQENWWAQHPDLVTGERTAQLTFAMPADYVEVGRYSTADGIGFTCQVDEDGTFALADGSWVYRVTAHWTDESRDYHGWAKYFICIESNP